MQAGQPVPGRRRSQGIPAMPVQHERLGSHGALVSNLCLGTMSFGWVTDEQESFRIMDRAL
jgi:hypothetical protein